MAKAYQEKLATLVGELGLADEIASPLEVKHFFSGAALYIDDAMCASLSPVGLAFKLPQKEIETLLASGEAKPLQYFPKGRIKKGYALFENPDLTRKPLWKAYFLKAARSG